MRALYWLAGTALLFGLYLLYAGISAHEAMAGAGGAPAIRDRARQRSARAAYASRGVGALAAALSLAAIAPRARKIAPGGWLRAAIGRLREFHSGVISDSVTWVMVGTAAFGAAAVVWLRTY